MEGGQGASDPCRCVSHKHPDCNPGPSVQYERDPGPVVFPERRIRRPRRKGRHAMTEVRVPEPALALPSDQDASGRSLGDEELALLEQVVRSGVLTSTKGSQVPALEARFAEILGVSHATACSSGTAAVHAAIVAVDPEPGDEIITTSITDMGALSPIIYQGAIPVFCDVDAATGNVTAPAIEARLSDRTRAIVVTH